VEGALAVAGVLAASTFFGLFLVLDLLQDVNWVANLVVVNKAGVTISDTYTVTILHLQFEFDLYNSPKSRGKLYL